MGSLELRQDGLSWAQELFGLEPRWTIEPEVGAIKQTVQLFRPSSTVEVEFLAEGAFNKLYNVSIDGELFIMRVSLPVDPYFKVMSEVATMDWARHITRLPIPKVVTYQSSRDNAIGFEWIFMSKMPGRPFDEICTSVSFAMKSRLVRELAVNSACLFKNQLRGIGNIYGGSRSTTAPKSSPSRELVNTELSNPAKARASADIPNVPGNGPSEVALPDVGRIVSMEFFWGSHIRQDIYRGPFRSSNDWITTRLMLSQSDCDSTLDKHSAGDLDRDDENEIEDATRTLQIVKRRQIIIPLVFPTDTDDLEPSIIFHDDLSKHNILVNDNGELSGILDSECVSALPLWKACDYPSF
ncbi:hypothetical protein N7475_002535 [Penicillium sp. IBT 31633x]|nr:hypothetical protein N7475_002535 [Penicillium sp. IBT 31633x]